MQSVLDPKELFSWLPGLNPPITLSQTETADSSQNTDTISFVLPPPCDRDGLKGLIKLALSVVKRVSFGYLELAGPARQSPKLIHVMRYVFCTLVMIVYCSQTSPVSVLCNCVKWLPSDSTVWLL